MAKRADRQVPRPEFSLCMRGRRRTEQWPRRFEPVDLLSNKHPQPLAWRFACRPWREEANLAGSPSGGGRTTFAVRSRCIVDADETLLRSLHFGVSRRGLVILSHEIDDPRLAILQQIAQLQDIGYSVLNKKVDVDVWIPTSTGQARPSNNHKPTARGSRDGVPPDRWIIRGQSAARARLLGLGKQRPP